MLEYFPNEIILELFSYLELTDLHRAFSSLNSRFEFLLFDVSEPLNTRLTSQSIVPLDRFFSRINNLLVIDCPPSDLLDLLVQSDYPRLNSVAVQSSNTLYFGRAIHSLIRQLLSLTNLRRFQLQFSCTLYILENQLPISSSISRLSLSMVTLDMLFTLLIHVPNLRSLSVWLNSNGRVFDSHTYDQNYRCLNLKKLKMGLHNDIKMTEVLFLLGRMPVLCSLEMNGSVWDEGFLDHRHWENIILGIDPFSLLHQLKIHLLIRFTTARPYSVDLLSHFRKQVFSQTHFSVTCDRQFWFHLNCLWNS